MTTASRRNLFALSVLTLVASFVIDPIFATDSAPVQVPEPSTFSLLAIAGIIGIGVSLIRRRNKK